MIINQRHFYILSHDMNVDTRDSVLYVYYAFCDALFNMDLNASFSFEQRNKLSFIILNL